MWADPTARLLAHEWGAWYAMTPVVEEGAGAISRGGASLRAGAGRARRAAADAGWSPVDLVVLATIVLTAIWWFSITRDAWFAWDEWLLAGRGRSAPDLLEPYNGHLSITYLVLYRLHMAAFGLDHHWVLEVIGLASLASVPLLLHLTTRRRMGTFAAGVAAVLVLWSTGPGLEAGAVNHSVALALAVVTAWDLERRSTRDDLVVAATLALGLATSGGMVAVAAGAVVHCALSRAPWRRWLAVVVPVTAWGVWYLAKGRDAVEDVPRLGAGDTVELVVDGYAATLRGLALGSTVGAWLLGLVVLAAAVRQIRVHRWRGATTLLAWSAAGVAWWFGLARSRGVLADPDVFRYRWVASVFLVLAIVPPVRLAPAPAADDTTTRGDWRRWATSRSVQAGALAALVVAVAVANADATRDEAAFLNAVGRQARVSQQISRTDPSPVPADQAFPLIVGGLTRQQVDDLVATYGPGSGLPADLDRVLVDVGAVTVAEPEPAGDTGRCTPPEGLHIGPVVLRTDGATTLWVRRFGPEPVAVAQLPPRSEVTVELAPDIPPRTPGVPLRPEGWVVEAVGACIVAG